MGYDHRSGIIDPELMIGCNGYFRGSITDMNIWNRPLTLKEVDVYTKGCENISSLQPRVFEWPQLNFLFQGKNVKNTSISKAELCPENSLEEKMTEENLSEMKIFGYKMDFYQALNLCHIFGGKMPLLKRNRSLLYKNIFSDLREHCGGKFWIPIVQSKKNFSLWTNAHIVEKEQEVDNLPWGYGEPNGKHNLLV